MSNDDLALPTPAKRGAGRSAVAKAATPADDSVRTAEVFAAPPLNPTALPSPPANDQIHPKETDMNAIPHFDLTKLAGASFAPGQSLISDAAQSAAKNLQVVTESLLTGINGLEETRTELLANGVKALQLQADSVAAFAKASSPQEALDLQQKFVREALDLQGATVRSLGGLFSIWGPALKPLNDRYSAFASSALPA